MINQPDVIRIVGRNILLAVGEFLSMCKELLEIGEARRHGFASCVDDCRVRQDALDQCNVHEVIGQLVDKSWLALAINTRAC